MTQLAKTISAAIISYGIAQEDERELYEYSVLILLEQVSIWLSIFFIAYLFNIFCGMILYMVFFIPLRIYAGGYHARTFTTCYFMSIGVFLCFAFMQKYTNFFEWLVVPIAIISATVILILSPMADPNKPMNTQEKVKYKKTVCKLLIVELAILPLILWFNNAVVIKMLSFSFLHLTFLLLVGKFHFRFVSESSEK